MGGNLSPLVAVLRQIDNVLTIILHLRFLMRTDLTGRVADAASPANRIAGQGSSLACGALAISGLDVARSAAPV